MHFTEIIERETYRHPNDLAIVHGEKKLKFKDLDARSNRLANAFTGLGIKGGDRIGVIAHNCAEYFETLFAAWKIGAITVNINFRLIGKEIEYLLNNSETSVLVFGEKFQETLEPIRRSVNSIRHFVCIGENPPNYAIGYEKLIGGGALARPKIQVNDDDNAFILYTSGTTGFPKGVPFTHRTLIAISLITIVEVGYRYRDNYLSIAPYYHLAVVPCLAHYMAGACTQINPSTSYDPELTAKIIEKEKITNVFMTPGMLRYLFKLPKIHEYDFSSWRACPTGAEPVPASLIDELREYLPTSGYYNMYGLTEGWLATLLKPHEALQKWPSVGKPVINTDVRVVDDSGEGVPPCETGEVIIRGDQVMKGYYKNPEATSEALKDGWLYSGDLGQFDEDGYLYIVGRKKDMIISGGENIYPAEVESTLYAHPKILEAAVFGIPDEQWGEVVKAVLVLKQGETLTGKEVIEYCKQNLASYKKPKYVEFANSLPRTDFGKINKQELKKLYGDREGK